VARKGAKGPIFEGDMPPKKMTPKCNAASGIIAGELLSGGVKVHTLLYGFFTVVTSTTMHPYQSTLSMPLGKLRTATIVKTKKFRLCLENS
jgi:hypothetical protein